VVNLANLCSITHALPRAGGVLDQDALLMHLFMVTYGAQQERQERDSKRR
jgi:hypothetical protein